MDKQLRLNILVCIFIIMILLGLIFRIIDTSNNLGECKNCIINFDSQVWMPDNYQGEVFNTKVNVSVQVLYDYYLRDKCYISWDKTRGFMKNG